MLDFKASPRAAEISRRELMIASDCRWPMMRLGGVGSRIGSSAANTFPRCADVRPVGAGTISIDAFCRIVGSKINKLQYIDVGSDFI